MARRMLLGRGGEHIKRMEALGEWDEKMEEEGYLLWSPVMQRVSMAGVLHLLKMDDAKQLRN